MEKVNLFLVGAARSGTSALADTLQKSGDIFVPHFKEPHFFAPNIVSNFKTIQEYEEIYQNSHCPYKLDASASYLYDCESSEYIFEYNPQAKIIIILRDPIERCLSHYKFQVRNSRENRSFKQAIADENIRKIDTTTFYWGFHYSRIGKYEHQISQFYARFNPKNIFITTYERLYDYDPKGETERLNTFLKDPGLDPQWLTNVVNSSFKPKFPKINEFLASDHYLKRCLKYFLPWALRRRLMMTAHRLNASNDPITLTPDTDTIQRLKTFYGKDVQALKDLGLISKGEWRYFD